MAHLHLMPSINRSVRFHGLDNHFSYVDANEDQIIVQRGLLEWCPGNANTSRTTSATLRKGTWKSQSIWIPRTWEFSTGGLVNAPLPGPEIRRANSVTANPTVFLTSEISKGLLIQLRIDSRKFAVFLIL